MVFDMIIIGLCSLFFLLTVVLSWKLYQFSLVLIDIEDAIEESLEILDEKYRSMNEIVQKPVFFDSVEVRQVIADIKDCHRAVLIIANKLTRQTKGIEESGETQEENS
jgi:hypothetical protein